VCLALDVYNVVLIGKELSEFLWVIDLDHILEAILQNVDVNLGVRANLLLEQIGGFHVLVGNLGHVLLGLDFEVNVDLVLAILSFSVLVPAREVGNKERVLDALRNAHHLGSLWLVPLFLVLVGNVKRHMLLLGRSMLSLPNVHLVVQLENEGVVVFQHLHSKRALFDLFALDLALIVLPNVPQAVLKEDVVRDFGVLLILEGGLYV